jgi:hypothetical protein
MALILHLSDVHLGNITDSQVLGDFKSDIVPLAERPNRIQAIEESLTQLGRELAAKGPRKNNRRRTTALRVG